MKKIMLLWKKFSLEINECHISAYASSAAFFMFLSLIPILLLFCSILPYTPVTEADLMEGLAQLLPASLVPIAVSTVADVYDKSPAIISVSALAAMWSAGKGMLAIIRGLNAIHRATKPQNYFFQRIRASIYTIILLMMILLSLLLGVFGESIGRILKRKFPEIVTIKPLFSNLRILLILAVLMLFFTALFTWIPSVKLDWKTQIIGACFVSVSWSAFSYVFSIYVNNFTGNSIYGNMTTVVMLMLWFYFIFYLLFLGALISKFLEPATEFLMKRQRSYKRSTKTT
jgi:membrane protein